MTKPAHFHIWWRITVGVDIEEWWPSLAEVVRRRLINHPWDPVAPYVMDEGGPASASGWWRSSKGWGNGELFLPHGANEWINHQPDTEGMREPVERDPRADYLSRGWPRRQG